MKRILFLGRFAPPIHGAARMNELYYDALKECKNFRVSKIKLNRYDSLEDIGKINKIKLIGYLRTIKELVLKIQKFNPDIIYLEMAPMGTAFFKDSVFILISKIFKKKIYIQFHAKGAAKTTRNKMAKHYYKFILKNSKIILLSNMLFSDIKSITKRKQVEILPNGIPDEITDEKLRKIIITRKKNKKPVLLFLSNMIKTKGPLDVLEVCNKLNIEGMDFECNFVGKFQDRNFEVEFKNKLKEFNLEGRCKYLGAKYGKEKNKILEKSTALIYPTVEDCFPLVTLEALMYGMPVFSYNTGAIREIISGDDLGFISKGGKWKELSREISRNKKFDQKKIRNIFKDKFEINAAKKRFLKLF
jgi:glycosyltransferase involved in cell wall biosynthesis